MPRSHRTVPAAAFKAQCLGLMDEVQRSGEEIVITKHGRPVARLVPVEDAMPSAYGALRGTTRSVGDIIGPDPELWGGTDPLDG
jgi:prevent-host-death family protein